MDTKSIFSSKMFWVNAIMFGIEIFQSLSDTHVVPEQWVLVGLPIANIILRWVTTQPVSVAGGSSN